MNAFTDFSDRDRIGWGAMPITRAATTTIPNTQVSRPWMSRTLRFSALSSGPNMILWYIVSRYIAARITAVAEIAPISFGSGKKPVIPVAAQVLFAVNVPRKHRNSTTKPHRPGRHTDARTITQDEA